MRHPVDSVCWSSIDKKYPTFASNPRNLRFGLATDGFNPFSNLSSTHSLWPVILVIYNLPPNAEMEAKLDEQPPTEGPIPVKHDVLSQVLDMEKNGRVRGMGAGITPSRVDAQLQSGAWKQAFEDNH
ncbi:hypothetical protein ACLB2K_053311 [Fragaria x ananassa]